MNEPGRKRILVVEDDNQLRAAICTKLALEGFNYVEASNGQEGLSIALQSHPDLILLDIIMPIMDGVTMLTRLRADGWGKKAKVIVLTNLNDSHKISEVFAQNAFDYIIKSDWKLEDVIKEIKDKLGV